MTNIALGHQGGYREARIYEVLGGVKHMAPRPNVEHFRSSFNLMKKFDSFFEGTGCEVFGEIQVFLSDEDKPIPDISVVCRPEIVKPKGIFGAPDLIVEVLSRSTSKRDRTCKYSLYERYGVKEYWIVDVKNRILTVFMLDDAGKYYLANEYYDFDEDELDNMTDDELAAVEYQFTTHLSDELVIDVREVFEIV